MSRPTHDPQGGLASLFTSTTGGVMTVEVGAITGDLELLTYPIENNSIEALVRYAGARDQYKVAGSPVAATDSGPHQVTHDCILQRLTTPGRIEAAGELPADITRVGE